MSTRDTAAAYVDAGKARDRDRFRALIAAAPRAVAKRMTVQDGRVVHVRTTSDLTVPARVPV